MGELLVLPWYIDPKNAALCRKDKEILDAVDLYVGGAERSVHLLYSRFWHKVLFDLGHVSTPGAIHAVDQPGRSSARTIRNEQGAAMSSIPTMWCANTAQMRFACTDVQGARSKDETLEYLGARGLYRFLRRVWRFLR
jgi:leucyl-tRNA synthetase